MSPSPLGQAGAQEGQATGGWAGERGCAGDALHEELELLGGDELSAHHLFGHRSHRDLVGEGRHHEVEVDRRTLHHGDHGTKEVLGGQRRLESEPGHPGRAGGPGRGRPVGTAHVDAVDHETGGVELVPHGDDDVARAEQRIIDEQVEHEIEQRHRLPVAEAEERVGDRSGVGLGGGVRLPGKRERAALERHGGQGGGVGAIEPAVGALQGEGHGVVVRLLGGTGLHHVDGLTIGRDVVAIEGGQRREVGHHLEPSGHEFVLRDPVGEPAAEHEPVADHHLLARGDPRAGLDLVHGLEVEPVLLRRRELRFGVGHGSGGLSTTVVVVVATVVVVASVVVVGAVVVVLFAAVVVVFLTAVVVVFLPVVPVVPMVLSGMVGRMPVLAEFTVVVDDGTVARVIVVVGPVAVSASVGRSALLNTLLPTPTARTTRAAAPSATSSRRPRRGSASSRMWRGRSSTRSGAAPS